MAKGEGSVGVIKVFVGGGRIFWHRYGLGSAS